MPDKNREQWLVDHKSDFDRGCLCHLHGLDAKDMSRDELLAFVGFLDELATARHTQNANRIGIE